MQTPQLEKNLPGLPVVTYRAGTWATFKASMLARLSSAEYPALAALKTRDDDDFSIALLDATSVVLDILTFYQERLANESFLRTATQLRSLTELARLIGYQPAPGVGASTYLAFTLSAPTGLPRDPSMPAITIPKGTQVQSAPAQGQAPQTFETAADIAAKSDWNALPVQTGIPWTPPRGNGLYLSGTSTQLQPGDPLLILGAARENWTSNGADPPQDWDAVVLNQVKPDLLRNLTYVAWDERLTHGLPAPVSAGSWVSAVEADAASAISLEYSLGMKAERLAPSAVVATLGSSVAHAPSPAAGSTEWTTAKVFALRQKAALFGNNAPDPNLFTLPTDPSSTSLPDLIDGGTPPWHWNKFTLQDSQHVDLNAPYPKIVAESWFALSQSSATAQLAQLYRATHASAVSLARFGLSAKVTELAADFDDPFIAGIDLRATEVWGQSEELALTEQPLTYPLYGSFLDLKGLRRDLAGVKAVALYGKSQKLSVNTGAAPMFFVPDDDSSNPLPLKPEDMVTILAPVNLPLGSSGYIPDWSSSSSSIALRVLDASGRPGTLNAPLADFTLVPASKDDPVIQEVALVSSVSTVTDEYPHTRIHVASELLNCYDRTATRVNANVAPATQGMSVTEILGSGSATPNQKFSLKQTPLTFVPARTPSGRESTLEVEVNAVKWSAVPTLYQQGSSSQVHATLNQPGGHTDILFGDGVEGATLPTGQNNIRANYRVGSGLSGNVAGGTITTLVDRPLGVSGVNNPQGATGGQDAQSVDDIRANAPLSVLTLGRAVSITDYQEYAATFAGIAKAHAIWIPSGPGRGVFITVAAAGGVALPPGNSTLDTLISSLHDYGNPLIPIHAVSFLETLFGLHADLKYDPAYDMPTVKAAVLQLLQQTYGFPARGFGEGISSDEITALIQSVSGVVAVNVTQLPVRATSKAGDLGAGAWSVAAYNSWLSQVVSLTRPHSDSPTRICPYLPIADPAALPLPAEILVLDPNPKSVVLGIMP